MIFYTDFFDIQTPEAIQKVKQAFQQALIYATSAARLKTSDASHTTQTYDARHYVLPSLLTNCLLQNRAKVAFSSW